MTDEGSPSPIRLAIFDKETDKAVTDKVNNKDGARNVQTSVQVGGLRYVRFESLGNL